MADWLDVALVARHSWNFERIPEVLAPRGARITYVGCPEDPLHRSSYVSESIAVGTHADCEHFGTALAQRTDVVASLPEWTLWGNDSDIRSFADCRLHDRDIRRVLPAATSEGVALLDSKVGLVRLLTRLGIAMPESAVADDAAGLKCAWTTVPSPRILKGDVGTAGRRVWRVPEGRALDQVQVPPSWFPVVIQHQQEGALVSVEALFRHGSLAAWQYSERTRGPVLEPTTARDYLDPPTEDVLESLRSVAAAAGLHGFANCSFVRDSRGVHSLFEIDMRANSWHQFGPRLGVDWVQAMRGADRELHPQIGRGNTVPLHLYPRALEFALRKRSWSLAAPWLTCAPGTWNSRLHADQAVNASNRQELREAAVDFSSAALRRGSRMVRQATVDAARRFGPRS